MSRDWVDYLARKIWDYLKMDHHLEKSDCILVMGNSDVRCAERGANLLLDGYAPLLVFSGGLGRITRRLWTRPEADLFTEVAVKLGIPREDIITENESTNTAENILFTRQILSEKGIDVQKIIVVQKPYLGRRTFATFKKNWPEIEIIVTSPQLDFHEYPNDVISKEELINALVGDLQRVRIYPEKGYHIQQSIPDDVWSAYSELVRLGFVEHLVKEEDSGHRIH